LTIALPATSAAKKPHTGVLSSFFGRKDHEGSGGSEQESAAAPASYHDQRFLKVLNSCGDSLTEGCKKKLLKAYQVGELILTRMRECFIGKCDRR
jgi:hypothetical protein